mgnify:CR=1 FL=1
MGIKIVGTNKKAYHEYYIEDVIETGIVLQGTEVKSLRDAKVNLRDSYCRIKNGELFVCNMHISPYDFGNRENHEPLRERKLLAHTHEILKLGKKVDEKGLALIPTKIYFKSGKAKLEVGIGKGKKLHDKRETLKKKQDNREVERAIRQHNH